MKYGSHVSFKNPDYLVGSGKESIKNNANSMMIYLGAPQSSKRVANSLYKLDEYLKNYSHIIPTEDIIIHAPYIINPSSLDKEKHEFAINFLIEEIKRINYIGAQYLVLHPGSYTTFSEEESYKQLVKTIISVLTSTTNTIILLETMSGKGTELCYKLEQISGVIRQINSDRVGICLDTCHIWDAGYDIKNNGELIIKTLKELNILEKVKVIHVNDSKNNLGSKKDRHENIGKGFIGLKALENFINNSVFNNIYKILETPFVNEKSIYNKEIELLFLK